MKLLPIILFLITIPAYSQHVITVGDVTDQDKLTVNIPAMSAIVIECVQSGERVCLQGGIFVPGSILIPVTWLTEGEEFSGHLFIVSTPGVTIEKAIPSSEGDQVPQDMVDWFLGLEEMAERVRR